MTHTLTVNPPLFFLAAFFLAAAMGLLLSAAIPKHKSFEPPQPDSTRALPYMIACDRKNFYFDNRADMERFRFGVLTPYEIWEQDSDCNWHYLGGNRGEGSYQR